MHGLRGWVGGLLAAWLLGGCVRVGYDDVPEDAGSDDGGRLDGGSTEAGVVDAGADADAIDPCSPEHFVDTDADGVCDREDHCEGSDDAADRDRDGAPDGCDPLSCGNGQFDEGETCDPSSAAAACPTACAAASGCEANVLRGVPQACNVECKAALISAPANDDGCCPSGANANNDTDCAATCGNQVTEPGEACDGGSLCAVDCSWTREGECRQFAGTATDDCKECRCAQCTEEVITCFGSSAGLSEWCAPIVNCGDVARCFGDECYCGTSASCANPNGPCKTEVEAAADASDQQPGQCPGSLSCAGYHASALGTCEIDHCNERCVQ